MPVPALLRMLPDFFRSDARSRDLDGRALGDLSKVIVGVVVVVTNLVGTAIVLALTQVVIPLPGEGRFSQLGYVVSTLGFVAFAVPFGLVVGFRPQHELRAWLLSGQPATPEQRALVLGIPWRIFRLQLALWMVAALLASLIDVGTNPERAFWTFVTVSFGGATTATCSWLLVDRLLRPMAARVLSGALPDQVGSGRGVALRSMLGWALGSGIPVSGLLLVGLRSFREGDISRTDLAVAVVVLAATALGVGLGTVRLAARATADPITGVAQALTQVRAGHFDVRVPVYDGTEIGRLQAGFNEMAAGLAEREQIRAAFGTYVDPEVVEHILREGTDLAGEEVEVTAIFIDIRGFTSFAERTPAREVVGAINRLFARAVPVIREHGGHVDKFVGDGLLAVFGAPRRIPDHAARAVMAALAIEDAVADEFRGELTVGIGANTGTVVAGNVGGAGRFEFSVIGDPVNVAARIESATRQTGDTILVAESTRDLAGDLPVRYAERPGIALKGKAATASLYAVTRA